MLYNIFLLVIIIILLSIKIYKNKDEFFNDYTDLDHLLDKEAIQINFNKSCKEECDNLKGTKGCYAYQHVGTAGDQNICRISKKKITSQNLIASTLNDPLHIASCPKTTESINPCDDGGIEKARRNKLKNICVNKTFDTSCDTLTDLCKELPPSCP